MQHGDRVQTTRDTPMLGLPKGATGVVESTGPFETSVILVVMDGTGQVIGFYWDELEAASDTNGVEKPCENTPYRS